MQQSNSAVHEAPSVAHDVSVNGVGSLPLSSEQFDTQGVTISAAVEIVTGVTNVNPEFVAVVIIFEAKVLTVV